MYPSNLLSCNLNLFSGPSKYFWLTSFNFLGDQEIISQKDLAVCSIYKKTQKLQHCRMLKGPGIIVF